MITVTAEAGWKRDAYLCELFIRDWSGTGVEVAEVSGPVLTIWIDQDLHNRMRDEKYFREDVIRRWVRFAGRGGRKGLVLVYCNGLQVLKVDFEDGRYLWESNWMN